MELEDFFKEVTKESMYGYVNLHGETVRNFDLALHLEQHPEDATHVYFVFMYSMTLLHFAVCKNCPAAIPYLLEKGPGLLNMRAYLGTTALMQAVLSGSIELVKTLLKYPVEMNIVDRDGFTALMHAIKLSGVNPELPQILIDGGADVNFGNKNGVFIPLFSMISYGNTVMVDNILNRWGGIPSLSKTRKYSKRRIAPLEYSLSTYDPSISELILEAHIAHRVPIPDLEACIERAYPQMKLKLKALHSLEECERHDMAELQRLRYRYFFGHSLVYILLSPYIT